MKLVFLGTRANLETRNRRHKRHSALLAIYKGRRVMVDCGADWLGRLASVAPHAVVLTHAHPDHAWGLKAGAGCPVYATKNTWDGIADFPVDDRRLLTPRSPAPVEGFMIEAFPVVHSLRAPAVGLKMTAGRAVCFYVPDVIDIEYRDEALKGVGLYIGDGSSLTRPLVRRHGEQLFGHTTVRAQLGWCQQAGIKRAIFTHCGSQIVDGDERVLGAELRAMARARGVEGMFAHDGMEIVIR
jgi:ribonuclease BN (tRNA processing enzyme)